MTRLRAMLKRGSRWLIELLVNLTTYTQNGIDFEPTAYPD